MTEESVPSVPTWLQNGFHRFLRPYLKRHFHAIAVERDSWMVDSLASDEPLLVYVNHPSWWDPLIAHFLNRSLFPARQFYAPIDAAALEQYRVFGKLGFYGVQMNSQSGAGVFLKQSRAILAADSTAIWMTPEGRFCDARDRSAQWMPGLAHLCTRMNQGIVLPLALEYVFWDERLPVCLAKFGQPMSIAEHQTLSKTKWNEQLVSNLRETQTELSELAIARSSDPFQDLIRGSVGAGFCYDSLRRIRSWVGGNRFRSRHGEQFE